MNLLKDSLPEFKTDTTTQEISETVVATSNVNYDITNATSSHTGDFPKLEIDSVDASVGSVIATIAVNAINSENNETAINTAKEQLQTLLNITDIPIEDVQLIIES